MTIDYQVIVNRIGDILLISAPIGIALGIASKLVNIFYSFLFGRRVNL